MTDSCWFAQVVQGENALNILFVLERVWNRYGTDSQANLNFEKKRSGME